MFKFFKKKGIEEIQGYTKEENAEKVQEKKVIDFTDIELLIKHQQQEIKKDVDKIQGDIKACENTINLHKDEISTHKKRKKEREDEIINCVGDYIYEAFKGSIQFEFKCGCKHPIHSVKYDAFGAYCDCENIAYYPAACHNCGNNYYEIVQINIYKLRFKCSKCGLEDIRPDYGDGIKTLRERSYKFKILDTDINDIIKAMYTKYGQNK